MASITRSYQKEVHFSKGRFLLKSVIGVWGKEKSELKWEGKKALQDISGCTISHSVAYPVKHQYSNFSRDSRGSDPTNLKENWCIRSNLIWHVIVNGEVLEQGIKTVNWIQIAQDTMCLFLQLYASLAPFGIGYKATP